MVMYHEKQDKTGSINLVAWSVQELLSIWAYTLQVLPVSFEEAFSIVLQQRSLVLSSQIYSCKREIVKLYHSDHVWQQQILLLFAIGEMQRLDLLIATSFETNTYRIWNEGFHVLMRNR